MVAVCVCVRAHVFVCARRYVAFAGNARDSRRTNVFINLVDNFFIDRRDVWATPFGRVRGADMAVVDKFYSGYSSLPDNKQPDQVRKTSSCVRCVLLRCAWRVVFVCVCVGAHGLLERDSMWAHVRLPTRWIPGK